MVIAEFSENIFSREKHCSPSQLLAPKSHNQPLTQRGTVESDTKDVEEFPVYSDTRLKGSGAKLQTCLCGSFSSTFDLSASKNVFEEQLFISESWHSVVCDLFASLLRWLHQNRAEV